MKVTNRICICIYGILCFITMGSLSLEIYRDYKTETESENQVENVIQSDAKKSYKYLVVEEDGVLKIYDEENKKEYMNTGVAYSTLPDRLKMKIENGLHFYDEKTLFAFLEDLSS